MAITNPADIASLRAWYDASDGASITLSGGYVAGLADKSGLGNDLTSGGAIAVATGHLNGRDTLHFPGGGSDSLAAAAGVFGGANQKRSFAFVVRFDNVNPGALLYVGDLPGGNERDQAVWLVNNANSTVQMLVNGASAPNSDGSLGAGQYYILIVTLDLNATTPGQNTTAFYIDGLLDSTKTASVNSAYTLRDTSFLLGTVTGGLMFTGYVAEAAVFNDVLTPVQAADLHAYFDAKWNAAPDGISFADFTDGQVIQRAAGATSRIVTLSGSYTGSPTAIEYRIVGDGTDTPIAGHDWTVLDAAPSGGAFSGDVDVPQGGWYNIGLRFSGGAGPVFSGASRWGVGVNVFMIGQSNMSKMKDVSSSPPTANALVSMVASGSWAAPAGNGVIALGNALATALTLPVGLIDYAVGGTAIASWDPGGSWSAAAGGLSAAGGDCEFVLWQQGESDALAATSKASYKASLATVYDQCRAATGRSAGELPFLVGTLGRVTSPPYSTETDATWQAIKDAQVEFCAETTGAALAGNLVDLPHADQLHLTGLGYEMLAARYARSILRSLGQVPFGGLGPRIASATMDGATVRVRLSHDGGSDFTPTSAITGFDVLDDGAPVTIISAVRQDSNVIALDLASVPAGVVTVRYQYGEAPDITGAVQDDSSLALPLLYANGLAVTAVPASSSGCRKRLAFDLAMAV